MLKLTDRMAELGNETIIDYWKERSDQLLHGQERGP
jgi:hypothetical protein